MEKKEIARLALIAVIIAGVFIGIAFVQTEKLKKSIQGIEINTREKMGSFNQSFQKRFDELTKKNEKLGKEIEAFDKKIENFYQWLYDGRYDSAPFLINYSQIEELKNLTTVIYVKGNYQWKWISVFKGERFEEKGEEKDVIGRGTGIFINNYLLTAAHVVNDEEKEEETKEENYYSKYWEKWTVKEIFFIHNGERMEAKRVFLNETVDVALLEVPKELRIPKRITKGNDSQVNVGNFLYQVGSLGLEGLRISEEEIGTPVIYIQEGIIGTTTPLTYIKEKEMPWEEPFPWDPVNLLSVTTGGKPGDSGGMIVAFRDGQPELIGMIVGGMGEKVAFAIKISVIEKTLSEAGLEIFK
ncbi:MAG: serine protease [Patescibacteria group bacterium]|nr:serine protease [Patescibacteria group bacterium]